MFGGVSPCQNTLQKKVGTLILTFLLKDLDCVQKLSLQGLWGHTLESNAIQKSGPSPLPTFVGRPENSTSSSRALCQVWEGTACSAAHAVSPKPHFIPPQRFSRVARGDVERNSQLQPLSPPLAKRSHWLSHPFPVRAEHALPQGQSRCSTQRRQGAIPQKPPELSQTRNPLEPSLKTAPSHSRAYLGRDPISFQPLGGKPSVDFDATFEDAKVRSNQTGKPTHQFHGSILEKAQTWHLRVSNHHG